MRDVQQVLADLKSLAQKQAAGQDTAQQQAQVIAELREHGIHVTKQPQPNPQQQMQAALAGVLGGRGASRFLPSGDEQAAHVMKALSDGTAQATGGGALGQPKATLAGAMQKALAEATPSAGGVLVPAEVSNDVMEKVRSLNAVMRMNPRVVTVEKELDLPSVATGATAYYVQENARIPVTEQTFALTPVLNPIDLAVLTPVSNRLLRDASTQPSLEEVIRNDMAGAIAGRADLAFLQGLGGGNEPLGIRNHPGVTPGPDFGANGKLLEANDFRAIVAKLRDADCPFLRPGWIFSPKVLTHLESLTDTTGRRLLDSGELSYDSTGRGGRLFGYPFATTTKIPTTLARGTSNNATYVIFGDFSEVWIGENLGLTIEAADQATYVTVDGEGNEVVHSAWQNRQHVFRAVTAHDLAIRRPQWVVVAEGVLV